jgi:CheY-like chemotaxis protein
MIVRPTGASTILIADDDHYAQKALEALLRVEGFHVIVAQDGQEALERITRIPPGPVHHRFRYAPLERPGNLPAD